MNKIKVIASCIAASALLALTGCEDPSGGNIQLSGQGSPSNYQITATYTHTVYSGSSGSVTAQVSDTVTRTDGGSATQSGYANVLYQRPSTGYSFYAGAQLNFNSGTGVTGVSAVIGWKW